MHCSGVVMEIVISITINYNVILCLFYNKVPASGASRSAGLSQNTVYFVLVLEWNMIVFGDAGSVCVYERQ